MAKVPLAFVNLKYVDSQRASRFKVWRRSSDEPVCALSKMQYKLLTLQNADEDPYIVAVLVALARQAEANGAKMEARLVTAFTRANGASGKTHFLSTQQQRLVYS